jgi:hypothetical protein
MPHHDAYDVFVSYNSDDQTAVKQICDNLKRRGLRCWLDIEELVPGYSWLEEAVKVVARTRAAVFFFGPNGPGEWQMQEWFYIYSKRKKVIPVRLFGADVPDELGLPDKVWLDFPNGPDNPKALATLYRAITDKDERAQDAEYSIHIAIRPPGLAQPQRTCFLALGDDGSPYMREALKHAIKKHDLCIVQSNENVLADANLEIYDSSPITGVRAASVVVADCTIDAKCKKPDPYVTFALGLAYAIGKPILIVTNEPLEWKALFRFHPNDIIKYDPTKLGEVEVNYDAQIEQEVAEGIEKLIDNQRHPFLIDEGRDHDIAVAFADVFSLRVSFWKRFREILRFHLCIQRMLREASGTLDHLFYLMPTVYREMTALGQLARPGNTWRLFEEAYTQFQVDHHAKLEGRLTEMEENRVDVRAAFEVLIQGTRGQVRDLLQKSCDHFEQLNSVLRFFADACRELRNVVVNDRTQDRRALAICLKTDIATLASVMTDIEDHSSKMTHSLLELIGRESGSQEE